MGETCLLEAGLRELGLVLAPGREEHLARFRGCLLRAPFNVTGLGPGPDLDLKGIVDSLTCLKVLSLVAGQRLVDVGSGAGLPGIPLAIAVPGLKVTLVEASARKSAFLRRTAAEIGLADVEVVTGRAEEFGRTGARESFDVAVSRAVGSLAVVAEYGLPLVRAGGLLLAMKGPGVAAELAAGVLAAAELGGGSPRIVELHLPVLGHGRALVLITKARATPAKYPRRAGVPARRPLGAR